MTSPKPNILILMTDQQRMDSLGCYGNRVCRTPHIDSLADGGIRFDRHYVTNPLCMPSRSSFLTGLYPRTHQVWGNGVPLREGIPTMADSFRSAGYRTEVVGKMHLTPYMAEAEHAFKESQSYWATGAMKDWRGPYYGFDYAALTLGHGPWGCHHGAYGEWLRENHPEVLELIAKESRRESPTGAPESYRSEMPITAHASTWIADETIRRLEGMGDNPFLLFASFPDPHHPFCPPGQYSDLYDPKDVDLPQKRMGDLEEKPPHYLEAWEGGWQCEGIAGHHHLKNLTNQQLREIRAHTYGMISLLDDCIGRILRALEEKGLSENTIVIFTSDHGDLLGDHGLVFKGPFMLEGLVHVPFLLRWPAKIEAGREYPGLSSHVDVLPTLLGLAGIEVPGRLEGMDLSPAEPKADPPREWVLAEFHSQYRPDTLNLKMLVAENWKTIHYAGQPHGELYNLESDPGEFQNLYGMQKFIPVQEELASMLLNALVKTEGEWPENICHA